MTLPPLPEPDTHCWDDDTGRDVWSHSTAQVDRLRDENKRLWADAERYRWLRKNTIVLGIFHYQIDDELEELVDGRIAAARAALKEKLNERD